MIELRESDMTARDLMGDGSAGNWITVELIPCLWFSSGAKTNGRDTGSADEQQLLSLLAARDRDWRSGPVKNLGEGMWQVDRAEGAAAFPSRAYCLGRASPMRTPEPAAGIKPKKRTKIVDPE